MSTSPRTFDTEFARYQEDIQRAQNERERAQYFIEFLRRLPELEDDTAQKVGYPADIRPELEKYLKTTQEQPNHTLTEYTGAESEEGDETVFIDVAGRLDARVGNLVIEFKDDLGSFLTDARDQLRRYVYLLYIEEEIEEDFLCLASDGQQFVTYEALLSDPVDAVDDVELSELTRIDVSEADTERVERWLMTLFVERAHPVVGDLEAVFGVDSSTFDRCIELLQEGYSENEAASVHREEWSSYLTYAQGRPPDEAEELFLSHTYLASFAKLLSYMVFTRGSMPSTEDAKRVLRGDLDSPFPDNLFEKDLFSWIGRTEPGDEFASILVDRLLDFNLGNVDQDMFKSLYEEMISYEVRHDLGEYYTPDWLATYVTQEKLDLDPTDKVLDPGCGSGTFLVEAIKTKRSKSTRPAGELVASISEEVVGIDIHPLAVMIAKANYVAAIEDLLPYRREQIRIPVYLADSVLFDEVLQDTTTLEGTQVRGPVAISEDEYYLPQSAIENPTDLDAALDLVQESLDQEQGFEQRLSRTIPEFKTETKMFERIRRGVAQAAQADRDSIHVFILKNFFRPLYLSENNSFDAIIGNPPWLTYRYMGEVQQNQTRSLLQRYGLHPGPENVVNMELATLFAVRCIDLYLSDGGQIGFVMPRSIFTANQHSPFREGSAEMPFSLSSILDLENVEPLFSVPTSVILGKKEGRIEYPIKKETITANLPKKNSRWLEVEDGLNVETSDLYLHGTDVTSWDEIPHMKRSVYRSEFHKGAEMWPRVLWFVGLQEDAKAYGFDSSEPPVVTSDYAYENAKRDEYKVRLRGSVEKEFLYETLLSSDIVPFTNRKKRTVVLPARPEGDGYSVLTADQAQSGGYAGLTKWLQEAEDVWSQVDTRVETIYDNIDYREKLSRQNSSKRYKVLYPESGSNLVSCVIDTQQSDESEEISPQAFLACSKLFYYDTDSEDEAYYLSAVLNSNALNEVIKSLQSRGSFGARDIHKTPWEFPVARYDSSNQDHRRLSQLAKQCEKESLIALTEAEEQYKATWRIREVIRNALSEELEEIDNLVEELLKAE